jgi:plastocyanin
MSGRRLTLLAVAASALALAVAGCGGGGGGGGAKSTGTAAPAPATGASTKLSIKADPSGQLKFDKKTLQAKTGKVTITMANPSQLTHSVAIEGNGVDAEGQVVGPKGTSTASATLKPGTYTFYCTVPGHRQAGMQGTLTVK